MHPRFFVLRVLLLACLAALVTAGAQAQDAPPPQTEFSIVLIPDPQNLSEFHPGIFAAQTQWIADNAATLNIKMVLVEGDLVNHAASDTEWLAADAAMDKLDGVVPYFAVIGNHDYENQYPAGRSASKFNEYFGPSRYAGYSWYKESYQGSNENFYGVVNIEGKDFLVLALEFYPRDEVLQWASGVLQANPDKEVIVLTHTFLYNDATRVDRCDTSDRPSSGGNDAEQVWTKLIAPQANVNLVVSGHITRIFSSYRSDIANNGNAVHQLYTNFQDMGTKDSGYLRILRYRPEQNEIQVSTYSPTLGTYLTDSLNQFTLKYRESDAGQSGSGELMGRVRSKACAPLSGANVASGSASVNTDAGGYYRLPVTAPGSTTAIASAAAHNTGDGVASAYAGYSTSLDFFLDPTPPCPLGADHSVTICTPAADATVESPFRLAAVANSSSGISYMQLYFDGAKLLTTQQNVMDTSVTATPGLHKVTVQAKEASGALIKSTINVNVGAPPPPPTGCTPGSTSPSVTLCSPLEGTTLTSPVRVLASSTSDTPMKFMQIYVDGVKKEQINGGSVDLSLTLSPGPHRIVVQGSNTAKQIFKAQANITVTDGSTTPVPCIVSSVSPSVSICSPANNAIVSSPVRVVAKTTSDTAVLVTQVYVDGVKAYEVPAGSVDVSLPMAAGLRRVTVQAKNAAGTIFKSTVNITVQ